MRIILSDNVAVGGPGRRRKAASWLWAGAALGIAVGILAGSAGVAAAGPLDLKDVSATAQWVAHIDVDAIKASTVVERVYDRCVAECPTARDRIAEVRAKLGFDLTEDIESVTFYGSVIEKGRGVVILRANMDQEYLVDKVRTALGYESSTYGSYTLHSWTHDRGIDGRKTCEHNVTGCFHTPSVLVFGRSEADVKAALDVLDRKAPGLAGTDSSLATEIPAGTMILARATGLADAKLPIKSPLVKQSDALSLILGEHANESFATVQLVTKSEEVAEQVVKVLEGFYAMATLHGQDHPEALEALGAIHVRAQGKTVTAEFRESADDVWKYGQKIVARLVESSGAKCPVKRLLRGDADDD